MQRNRRGIASRMAVPLRHRDRIRALETAAMLACVALTPYGLEGAETNRVEAIAPSPDGVWVETDETTIGAIAGARQSLRPSAYRTFRVDHGALSALLMNAPMEFSVAARTTNAVMTVPMPDGTFSAFRIEESPIMAPELARKFPEIKTYLGQGIDDPLATLRCDETPAGFHAMILSPNGSVFVDPFQFGDTDHYISYYKRDARRKAGDFKCLMSGSEDEPVFRAAAPPSGTTLRTYKLACAATVEYTTFHSMGTPTVAQGLAAVVTTINRVTGIFEVEVAIRLVLVANNNLIIYTTTDPYTNSSAAIMLTENQLNLDNVAVIGSANYDIGHVFGTGAGGLAQSPSTCLASVKGRGVTGIASPIGDAFDVDFVAHEMGHQFGAQHTFNSTGGGSCSAAARVALSAYEPGSGSTIMAYAGICGVANVQLFSDPYFHTHSFDQIVAYRDSGGACGAATATGNTPPTVTTPLGFLIPTSTGFTLTGVGTDPDGGGVTYTWEQLDLGAPSPPPNNANGPLFRSRQPSLSPSRMFRNLTWETLPTASRTMRFRVTVRDHRAGGGGVNNALTVVTAQGAPFAVTSPNGGEFFSPGSEIDVTWSLGGGVATEVTILFSSDAGATYTTITNPVANDGSQTVSLPCTPTTMARIRIEAVDNIFFDESDADFTVTGPVIYVNANASGANDGTNWSDAINDLQDALDLHLFGCGDSEIWAAAGTYRPDRGSGDRDNAFHLANGLAIYGGFDGNETTLDMRDPIRNVTVLSGNIGLQNQNSDNSHHVVTGGAGLDATAVLDGFTVTKGQADGDGTPRQTGGGMRLTDSPGQPLPSPTLRNIVFMENVAEAQGGGLYVLSGSPTLTNCAFRDNSADNGGAVFITNGDSAPTFINCSFVGNTAAVNAGAFYNIGGSPTLINCLLSGNVATNLGGGMYHSAAGGSSTLINCLFSGNLAPNAAGLYLSGGNDLSLLNCTFAGNVALTAGSGVFVNSHSPTIANCILWGNSAGGATDEAAQIHIEAGATPTVEFSCVQGCNALCAVPADGNIGDDPLFVDSDGCDGNVGTEDDDLRLSGGSPCIDGADNTRLPFYSIDPEDLDRHPRFVDDPATSDTGIADPPNYPSIADMGAYEFVSGPTASDDNVPPSGTVDLFPSCTPDPTICATVQFTNLSGSNGCISAIEPDINLHPGEATCSDVGFQLVTDTSLLDGTFRMVVSIPFSETVWINAGLPIPVETNLGLVDVVFFNKVTATCELSVAGNCGNPPVCDAGALGMRFANTATTTQPIPSNTLGDYGIFFNTSTRRGYVFAVVDHTTDFSSTIDHAASTVERSCCLSDGACFDSLTDVDCRAQNGTAQQVGASCTASQACCVSGGSVCIDADPLCCDDLGGVPVSVRGCFGDADGNGIDDACEERVDGACCLPEGSCTFGGENDCFAIGGQYQGDGTPCEDVDCEAPIPTVSEWGLVVMALLLLTGAKIYFGRPWSAEA